MCLRYVSPNVRLKEADMSTGMKRRDFMKAGAAPGAAAFAGDFVGAHRLCAQTDAIPDIAAVTGTDRLLAVNKGLAALGGMKKFVTPGSSVGLLINAPAWWTRPGSHTHPELTLAVVLAALEAGAKEIHYLLDPLGGDRE